MPTVSGSRLGVSRRSRRPPVWRPASNQAPTREEKAGYTSQVGRGQAVVARDLEQDGALHRRVDQQPQARDNREIAPATRPERALSATARTSPARTIPEITGESLRVADGHLSGCRAMPRNPPQRWLDADPTGCNLIPRGRHRGSATGAACSW